MSDVSRRNFLKITAGSCATLALSGLSGCDTPQTGPAKVHAFLADELSEIYDLGKQACETLGIKKNSMKGATVFIKPNFLTFGQTRFNPMQGICTKPELAIAAAEMCLEAGAAKVTIGEGAGGISWDWQDAIFCSGNEIYGATNIKAAVDYLNSKYGDAKVQLFCLNEVDEWKFVPSSSNVPLMRKGLVIAKSFEEADHVISIPTPKSHIFAYYTGTLKNYFGVVSSLHMGIKAGRVAAHRAYVDTTCGGVEKIGVTGAFMDIHRWRMDEGKDDFAIMDCTIGIEGNGPEIITGGTTIDHKQRNPIGKYAILACTDLVAADTIGAGILNFSLDDIKQFAVARNWGIGEVDNVELVGAALEDLVISDWKKPQTVSEDMFRYVPGPVRPLPAGIAPQRKTMVSLRNLFA